MNLPSKKDLTVKDFEDLMDSESIAFNSYDLIIRKKKPQEFVDLIACSFCNFNYNLEQEIPIYYKAMLILKRDYEVDFYSLPFYKKQVKLEVKRYDLMHQFEKRFRENNIPYNDNNVFNVADNYYKKDKVIKKLMDEITEVAVALINIIMNSERSKKMAKEEELVYSYSETIANSIAHDLKKNHEDYVSKAVVRKVVESFGEDENLVEKVFEATLNLLNERYKVELTEDINIAI